MYIYPGIISLSIYSFVIGHSMKENKITLLKGMSLSYIYVSILSFLLERPASSFGLFENFILIFASISLPIILNFIKKSKLLVAILKALNIYTEPDDNWLDLIKSKGGDKGIALKVFLDDQNLMYQGKLREHESDTSREQIVCLSGFRRYVKKKDKFVLNKEYSGDNSHWVALKIKNVTRIEIDYQKET